MKSKAFEIGNIEIGLDCDMFVIAGPCVRAILELVGVKNALTKSYGSNNPINLTKAVMDALCNLRDIEQVAALRGVELST